MPGYTLQCFNAELYATLTECKRVPRQCIAPTVGSKRCKIQIEDEIGRESDTALSEAQKLPDGNRRNELIELFVLDRCCKRHHRLKLEADKTGCLDKIVKMYGEIIRDPPAEPIPVLMIGLDDISDERGATTLQAGTGMQLRSHTNTMPQGRCRRSVEYFEPYKSGPKKSILECLLGDKPPKCASGDVYSFKWAKYPLFVKIGFSAKSAESRLSDWQKCHPGATLSMAAVNVRYPQRVERLVHLQLAQHRYRIGQCETCHGGHNEWFKSSADEVNQVISDWVQLMERYPFYELDESQTAMWKQRLYKFHGNITARALLDWLDAEEKLSQKLEKEVLGRLDADEKMKQEHDKALLDELEAEETMIQDPTKAILDLVEAEETQKLKIQVEGQRQPVVEQAQALEENLQPMIIPAAELAIGIIATTIDMVQQHAEKTLIEEEKSRMVAKEVPAPELFHDALATTVDTMQQHDLTLTYFAEFMLLLAQTYSPQVSLTRSAEDNLPLAIIPAA